MDTGSETIDRIAFDAPADYFDVFRIVMAMTLSRFEKQDSISGKSAWAEDLAVKFVTIAKKNVNAANRLFKQLRFITLNYDRSFNWHFFPKLYSEFQAMLKPREFEKKFNDDFSRFIGKIYHVHGALGALDQQFGTINAHTYMNPGTNMQVAYGENPIMERHLPFIAPVDDLRDARNMTYDNAKDLIANAENCVCLGLSPDGITNCEIQFQSFDVVYYSGREKVYDNFEPVGKRASALIAEL